MDSAPTLQYLLRDNSRKDQFMKKTGMVFASLITLFLFTACLSAPDSGWAQSGKFAQINLTDVSSKSTKVKNAVEQLLKMQTAGSPKMESLTTEAKKLEADLEKGKDTLKQAEKEKLENDLTQKYQEMQSEQQSVRSKLAVQQQAIQTAIMNQIQQIIDKIAKDEGYSAVFLKETMIYSSGMPDLTEMVIKALDSAPALDLGAK
jgi:outer membrane protein